MLQDLPATTTPPQCSIAPRTKKPALLVTTSNPAQYSKPSLFLHTSQSLKRLAFQLHPPPLPSSRQPTWNSSPDTRTIAARRSNLFRCLELRLPTARFAAPIHLPNLQEQEQLRRAASSAAPTTLPFREAAYNLSAIFGLAGFDDPGDYLQPLISLLLPLDIFAASFRI
jgi:hypothetical protein